LKSITSKGLNMGSRCSSQRLVNICRHAAISSWTSWRSQLKTNEQHSGMQ
jgi:hypothetical protein